ncbi:MAG: Mrp/NBP35 family ATP-binding protein, partial [Thermoplasmata archaeon]|nr:Mrp/NBP35 family ATP-binding protein [Thermoplasmata archaeon]
HKLIVMSGKGGVGKSTVAVNLAVSLAKKGKAVGILDADMHGPSVPKLLGMSNLPLTINDKERIVPFMVAPSLKVISIAFLLRDPDSPVIWRGPIKMGAIKQFLEEVEWGALDYLIIDLPPGTGDEPLSVAQLVPDPDGAVIVTTPQEVALISVRKSINFAKAVGLRPIGLIENMSGMKCPHCGKDIKLFNDGGAESTAKEHGIPLLGKLPLSVSIANSGDSGSPFATADDDDAAIFDAITERIVAAVEQKKET